MRRQAVRLNLGTRGADARLDLEPECRSLADFAVDANGAAMRLDELTRNGQAEASAAEAVDDGFVSLREALEDARLRVGRNANAGVGDFKAHAIGVFEL